MKLVLDTNVYIAAFLGHGLTSDILRFGQRKKVELFTSPEIIVEIREKLTDKFKIDLSVINEFITSVREASLVVEPQEKISIVTSDPEVNKILECAVAAQADLIISMDRHLLKLKRYQSIGIVHPKTLTWILPKVLG